VLSKRLDSVPMPSGSFIERIVHTTEQYRTLGEQQEPSSQTATLMLRVRGDIHNTA
jgi:hypothetical protein